MAPLRRNVQDGILSDEGQQSMLTQAAAIIGGVDSRGWRASIVKSFVNRQEDASLNFQTYSKQFLRGQKAILFLQKSRLLELSPAFRCQLPNCAMLYFSLDFLHSLFVDFLQ